MKFEWNRRDSTIAAYAFIVLALAICFYSMLNRLPAFIKTVSGVLTPIAPIFYGLVLAYLLNPLLVLVETKVLEKSARYRKMTRRRRRTLSLLVTYLFAVLLLTVFVVSILPQVIESVTAMAAQLQSYVTAAEQMAYTLLDDIPEELLPPELLTELTALAGTATQKLISWLSGSVPLLLGLAMQFGSGVISAFVAVVVSMYLLGSKEMFLAQTRKTFYAFLSGASVSRIMHVAHTAHTMFGRFIIGTILDSILVGVVCFAGLSIMSMPNAVLVSFIVGVTNMIPYFGPFIGAIPSFFLIAIVSPVQGLVFLVFILVLQQLDGNILAPMILGDSIGISAFWVVFAVLLFGGIFGIPGMFVGVPLFGVIYWVIKQYIEQRLIDKKLPTDTACYHKPLDDDIPSEQNP